MNQPFNPQRINADYARFMGLGQQGPVPQYAYAFTNKLQAIMRQLMKHRERYIRAWMAHYKAHPADVHIVTRMQLDGGEIMRMEFRHDSDPVLKLVKAAQYAVGVLEDNYCPHSAAELAEALEPFNKRGG